MHDLLIALAGIGAFVVVIGAYTVYIRVKDTWTKS